MAKQVAATDYVAAKAAAEGLPITAEWRNGHVSVGGELITPTKIVDGKAYVNETDIDNAINRLKERTGVKNNSELFDVYFNTGEYKKQLNKLANRKEFSYVPEDDTVYQAYRQQYNREGARQTEDTMGIYSALTGGMGNSSAVTAAAQAGQYWNAKLMDVIPELAENAYERYVQEFEMDREALADILDVNTALYDRAYKSNRDTISDIESAWNAATERDRYNREQNEKAEQMQYERNTKAEQTQYDRGQDALDRAERQAQQQYKQQKDDIDRQDKLNQIDYDRSQDALDRAEKAAQREHDWSMDERKYNLDYLNYKDDRDKWQSNLSFNRQKENNKKKK